MQLALPAPRALPLLPAPKKAMSKESVLRSIAADVLVPLCDRTKDLVSPINLMSNDYLHVDLVDNGRHFYLKPYALVNGQYKMASNAARSQWVTRIPERREQGMGEWVVAATDFTALIIHSLWPADRLNFTQEAKAVYNYLLLRFFQQTIAAQRRALYKATGQLPPAPEGFIDHGDPTCRLSNYQKVAVFTQWGQEGAADYMQQGTGKTPTVLAEIFSEAAQVWKTEHRMYRALIVAPKNVRLNWQKEVHKFATIPGRVAVLRGGKLDRVKILADALRQNPSDDSQFAIVVASYEGLCRTWPLLKSASWDWDMGVLDESHYIKDWARIRAKTALELRGKCKKRRVLTGTPITNAIHDLWSQLEFLGEGLSGFLSPANFRTFYGKYEKDSSDRSGRRERFCGVQNMPLLQERLARLAYIITKEEAMPELPEKMYDVVECAMTPEQCKIYMQARDKIVLEIENDLASSSNKTLTVTHILTKLLRLAQITAGYVKWDADYGDDGAVISDGKVEYFTSNPKIEWLLEELKSKEPTSKTIIWSCFVPSIKQISRELTAAGIKHVCYYGGTSDKDRAEAERAFNEDPDCKVFLGNPAAGGVGINLWGYNPAWAGTPQDHGCNCDHIIYFACNWNYAHRAQSEDRAHRRGTRCNVRITDLTVPGTVDEEIRNRVMGKKLMAYEVQDVREILEAVLRAVPEVGEE